MQTAEVLAVLRGAANELRSYESSRPGTPTAAGGGGGGGGAASGQATPPSTTHLLLQISALHKAFLALSEAFLEEMSQRQGEREEQARALASVRRECAGKLEAAAALQADLRQLAAADGQQAHTQAVLAQRCHDLEEEVARLRLQLEDRQAEAAEAVQQRVEAAVARQLAAAQQQWQQQLAEAAEVAVQRWSSQALPPLLAPMQEAVAATAELAASVATEAAGLSGDLRQLAERCGQQEEALSGLQQRVCDAEGCGQPGAAAALLDEQLRQRQQADLEEVQRDVEALSLAACELPGLQQQLAAVAEQQAQHAATTDGVVQSVMTDVKALARHTKALDKEMRSLRKEARATQEALLRSCSAFSRALSMQSPLGGPFTAFPVEKE